MTSEEQSPLLDQLPAFIFHSTADDRRTMLKISPGCLILTGYSASELTNSEGVSYGSLILPQDKLAMQRKINQALQERQPYHVIYRIKTGSGKERWVQEQGQVVDETIGEAGELEGIVTDYHEQMSRLRTLKQRIADRTGHLSALYDILEAASDAASTETTIKRILERVLQAVNVDAGAIHLLDRQGKQLNLVAQQGLSDTLLESNATLDIQESPLVGWVVRNDQPLLIPDVAQDERARSLRKDNDYRIYAGVPISAADQLYGVLSILAKDGSQFQALQEIELLVSVGEQIGVVVENAQLRDFSEQLMLIEERNRLARELHDSVTQSLYSVTLFAEAARRQINQGALDQAQTYLTEVSDTGRQALKEMRLLVHRLRPSLLAKQGLVRAIQHRLNAVEGRSGVVNQLIVEGELLLSPELEEALYYIAQEALNNALKHAEALEVVVILRAYDDGYLELLITDNGLGFDPAVVTEVGGLGLTSMVERAEALGGQLTVTSAPGKGTTIHAQMTRGRHDGEDSRLPG